MNATVSKNNFDLIRLIAASQVAVLHVFSYVTPAVYRTHTGPWSVIESVLIVIPGVPIFFFISGLLISRSYERAASTRIYATNRVLRIFPALHVCVLINLLMIWGTGYFSVAGARLDEIIALYLAKTTFIQFANPEFMRHFGDGVLNGSLWTICVELQFYLLLPLIYKLFATGSARRFDIAILCLIGASIIGNRALYATQSALGHSDYWKLMHVSFAPWLYMFLTGVLVQRHFARIARILGKGLFVPVGLAYVTFALIMEHSRYSFANDISPLLFFPLAIAVLTGAYSAPLLAGRLLKGNDFSYGIYIYHVPIMDEFLYLGLKGTVSDSLLVLLIAAGFAIASWYLIERPSLRMKLQSIHPLPAASV